MTNAQLLAKANKADQKAFLQMRKAYEGWIKFINSLSPEQQEELNAAGFQADDPSAHLTHLLELC